MSHIKTLTKLTIVTLISGLLVGVAQLNMFTIHAESNVPTMKPSHNQRPQDHRQRHGKLTTDVANLLGMERQELIKEWQKGKTLVQIAHARKGWNEETFTKKISDIEIHKINEAIKSGKLSAEQGAIMKKKLPERLKNALNHKHGNHHKRMPGTYSHL